MRKSNLLMILVILTLFSCSTGRVVVLDNSKEEPIELIPFEVVGKGALFGAGEEGISESRGTIISYLEWIDLKKKMNSVNNISDNFSEGTLNFEEEMVLFCFDQVRGSGGYEVEIIDVFERKERLEVIIKYTRPSEMAPSVLTQPFCIVKLPRTDKDVVFKEKE